MVSESLAESKVSPWILEQYGWYSFDRDKIEYESNYMLNQKVTLIVPGSFMLTNTLHGFNDRWYYLYPNQYIYFNNIKTRNWIMQYPRIDFFIDKVYMVGRTKQARDFSMFLEPIERHD